MKTAIAILALAIAAFAVAAFAVAPPDAPPTVSQSNVLTLLNYDGGQVKAVFQPTLFATVNGVTTSGSIGQAIGVTWSPADTTSVSITDINGATQWVPRTAVLGACLTIANQQLAAKQANP